MRIKSKDNGTMQLSLSVLGFEIFNADDFGNFHFQLLISQKLLIFSFIYKNCKSFIFLEFVCDFRRNRKNL